MTKDEDMSTAGTQELAIVISLQEARNRYRPGDGQGLYLDVRPSGAKIWRYRYWITPDKDGIYTIGEYPGVSLSDARREHSERPSGAEG